MTSPLSNTLKIAIISDTHGEINADILNAIKGCDQVIHAGDICGAHVLEQLKEHFEHITAVTGNNDAPGLWAESETAIVSALPAIAEIELPGGTVVIEHGHKHGMHQPEHSSLRVAYPHARTIVYGHTHTMLVDDDNKPWVINPGAAGATRTRGGASCMILSASADSEWNVEMIRFKEKAVA
ncbi:hypothetical protein MNBD_GAMMA09-2232 [hydrothermal vent metagenome]|uniref:Calcineurin-like phosphoesterase domain-containing protein n=1 Tax=hydrothermal vent metagenome TaxID=652676 RepID=A0A3B0XZ00_9ZZZZ